MGLTAPDDLSPAERSVWDVVAPFVDAESAAELVRVWCSTVVELRSAEAWVAEHGTTLTMRDDKGNVRNVVQAPKYVQARALRADLVKMADALRLSPRALAAGEKDPPVAGSGGTALDELTRRRSSRGAVSSG